MKNNDAGWLSDGKRQAWFALQQALDYHFADPRLLGSALCHRSFANENSGLGLVDNERLEFLGDAVLDLVIAQCLVRGYVGEREGELTRVRAEVVAEPSLALIARQLSLGQCLLLGRGELRSGGRSKTSLLADALEALFGAIFVEAGYQRAAEVILPLFEPLVQRAFDHAGSDFKTRLQEHIQANKCPLPVYRLVEESGPDHQPSYQVEVAVAGKVWGAGCGPTKKKAEQAAARAALAELEKRA
ncbi:MAG: ribonuclease III [Desulfuromonas sp.]|nr:MAG: ribonuclease III [Desulfuromonas sp.]